MNSHLIKYANGLVGQYYQTDGNTKLAIMLGWAPSVPTPPEQDAKIIANWWFDLVRPDYYGYGRSDGFFSPKNCIQTAYDTLQVFRDQWTILSVYENEELATIRYDEIVIIGLSFGGWIASILPKFDDQIKEVVLLYPWFGYDDMNQLWYPEESDEEFLRLLLVWYKHLYRFAEETDPYEAMLEIDEFNSTIDASHLEDTKIFVWHGTGDDVIWSWRSKEFVEKLKEMNPHGDYHYAEYYGLWHGGTCKEAGLKWWLHWRKQFN